MSNKLDRELAEAIGSDDAPPVAKRRLGDFVEGPPPVRAKKAPVGLLLGLLVMVGGLTSFFFFGLKPAAIYAVPTDQVLANQAKFVGRKIRLEGELVPGTLAKRDQPCEYRFSVHAPPKPGEKAATAELPIRYGQCVIPDTFRDVPQGGVQVTVEGALDASGSFEATMVMAKCASKYDPKEHKMREDGAS